jgi:hypothetical protein
MVPLRRLDEPETGADLYPTPARVFGAPTADARALLAMARAWVEAEPQKPARWSLRRTLAFVTLSSAILWAGVIVLGASLLR